MQIKHKTKPSQHSSHGQIQQLMNRKTNASILGNDHDHDNIHGNGNGHNFTMNQLSVSIYRKITNRNSYQNSMYGTSGKYNQEYHRIQENDRILKRIINPKRDKIILKSVEVVKKESKGKSKGIKTRDGRGERGINDCQEYCEGRKTNWTTVNKYRSEQKPRRKWVNCINNRNILQKWRIDDSQSQFQRIQQNERMGKRIMNVKSIYRNLATCEPGARPRINPNSKVNKGVKAFFHVKSQKSQILQQNIPPQSQFFHNLKPFYGYGPTVLILTNICLTLLPQPKQSDLFMFQLLIKSNNQKRYRTCFIPYKMLYKSQIKFALRLKKIGEFVPLKVWKACGVENIQIGIVDILFGKYLQIEGQDQCLSDTEQYDNLLSKQNSQTSVCKFIESNKQGKTRVIMTDKLQTHFRKQKKQELHGSIAFDYAIYRKKYK